MNLIDLTKHFGTPQACNDYLEATRWPDGEISCLKCAGKKVTKFVKQAGTRQRLNASTGEMETKAVPPRFLYICLDCKYQFSVTTGTIFKRIPPRDAVQLRRSPLGHDNSALRLGTKIYAQSSRR